MHKLLVISRLVVGLVFTFSGIIKLTDLIGFHYSILQYNILPFELTNPLAILIPVSELICGFLLLFNIFVKGATVLLKSLIIMFIIAIIYALINNLEIDCSCFGRLTVFSKISLQNLMLDIMIFIMLLMVFLKIKEEKKTFHQIKLIGSYILVLSMFCYIPYEYFYVKYSMNILKIEFTSFENASELSKLRDAIIIDARIEGKYLEDHIKGAINIPFSKANKLVRKYNFDKEQILIVYCDGSKCTAAQRVANRLITSGYSKVFIINEDFGEQ